MRRCPKKETNRKRHPRNLFLVSPRSIRYETVMNSAPISRRRFIAGVLASATAPAFLRAASPNEKLNLAVIACGGRGAANLKSVSSENIVALCDVEQNALDAAILKHPKARRYKDFRRLYDQAKDIDAVVVSTPEHTHAFATLPALQLGKHV